MYPIQNWQIKALYALGGSLGIVERGSHDDGLHALVGVLTGKETVTALTQKEANLVLAELRNRMEGMADPPKKKKQHPTTPGGMTGGQQDKVWRMMYQLTDCDPVPSSASLGIRVAGIIRREFGIDATGDDPFRWLTYQQGSQLIEALKGYVKSARTRQKKGGVECRMSGNCLNS